MLHVSIVLNEDEFSHGHNVGQWE